MVSLKYHYLPYLAMQKRGDLKYGETKRWKASVFPCWNGDAQKRLLEKCFQTECIVTWHSVSCVAQGLVFVSTVLPFFCIVHAEMASLYNKTEVVV